MKTLLKTLGIVVIATIIGFSMTACGGGGGGGYTGGPNQLTENVWKEGIITEEDGFIEYTFTARFVIPYYIWWNDSGQGDGSFDADIVVSAFRSNGDAIASITNVDSAWGTPQLLTLIPDDLTDPTVLLRTETILLRVELKGNDIDNEGNFAIVYSTTNSQPPIIPSTGIIPLTENVWEDGNVANANDAEWYSLTVANEATYYFWWNEKDPNGNGSKSGDVSVSFYYSNGTAVASGSGILATSLVDLPTAWATSRSFPAASSGTVYVRVKPANAAGIGTYGIVYSTTNSKPAVPFNVPAVPLTELEWEDGNLPTAGSMDWYSIEVTDGTTYNLWWNERGSYGDGTKTADIKVSVITDDGDPVSSFTDKDSSWTGTGTPASYTATYDGIVYVKVVPNNSSYTGTYGIVYSTKSTRPLILPDDITELTVDVWEEGEIATNAEDWYSFEVTSGDTYYLWWNENGANGNNSKTGNVSVSAWYLDGTVILNNVATAWATAASITATSTETVYLRVTPVANGAGTYDIVYSENSTRSTAPFSVSATPLTELEWKDGNLPTANSIDWYSITVTNATAYNLWWNETGSTAHGNGTKTGNVSVIVVSNNGTVLVTEKDYSWETPTSFTASYAGNVYVRVVPASNYDTGTYSIVYSTKTTRPLILPANITPLVADQWTDGDIPGSNGIDWYSISVTAGTYYLWWNETGNNGNGSKTADVSVSIPSYRDGTTIAITNQTTAWATPASFTVSSAGTVYISVAPVYSSPGTYGIVYSTTSTRPKASIVGAIPLQNGSWADGNIGAYARDWYSIQVTVGATYYFWWNERPYGNSTKTGDVRVSAWYDNGTTAFAAPDQDTAWTTPYSFTAISAGTVYVRVIPATSGAGTYGIAYNTNGTRPTVPTP